MYSRLLVVLILGFSSGLPLALVGSTLQAWFASSGATVMLTGCLSLLGLPYVLRLFWSPLVDQYPLLSFGRRRSWLIITQLALMMGFLMLSFLSPQDEPNWIIVIALLLAIFSATQDTVIDAQRIEYLPCRLHAMGASLSIIGYRLAMMVAGGLALIQAEYWGWRVVWRVMAACMLPALVATLCSREPIVATENKIVEGGAWAWLVRPFLDLIQRPGFYLLAGFVITYKLGEAFTATTSGIVMPFLLQGLGFSLSTVGYINKILGTIAMLSGGLLAGWILMRHALFYVLLVFGLLQALSNALFAVLAGMTHHVPMLIVAVTVDNFAAGLGTTALVAFLMRVVNRQYTAVQFSLLVAIASLPRVVSGPLAAMLVGHLGWIGLYRFSVLVALLFIPFWWQMRHVAWLGLQGSLHWRREQSLEECL